MNAHYCAECGRGFWCRESLGVKEKLPKHERPDTTQPCPGSRKLAVAVKPPLAS